MGKASFLLIIYRLGPSALLFVYWTRVHDIFKFITSNNSKYISEARSEVLHEK